MKKLTWVTLSAACALAACGGGGGNDETRRIQASGVTITGASLADMGALGFKFTVQPSASAQVYTERIAAAFGVEGLCSAYTSANGGLSFTNHAGCTNYAVAGASVGNYSFDFHAALGQTSPFNILKQLADIGTAGVSASHVYVVGEAPANDVAQLATAYLGQAPANGSDFANMMATLSLDSTTLNTLLSTAQGRAQLGGLYMQTMADRLTSAIVSNLLNNGARRVAVLNVLDVTLTPKFQSVLAQLNVLDSSGATAAGFQAAVRAWVQAFNTRLSSNLAAYQSKVIIVDFYTSFLQEMADPAQFGLTNVSATVCDEVVNAGTTTTVLTAGATALSTPSTVGACTSAAASALTPQHDAVNGTNWWKTYLYADNFHPTPYGHQLLAQLVTRHMAQAGWL